MNLPKNPLWPVSPSWRFNNEGDVEGGGGGEATHWIGKDKDLQTYADGKGFKDAISIAKAHRDLEKKHEDLAKKHGEITAKAGELEKKQSEMFSLPGKDATDEDWDAFAGKLRGRNLSDYANSKPDGLYDGAFDESLSKIMTQAAYDSGMPSKMYAKFWNLVWKGLGSDAKTADDQLASVRAEDEKTLRVKWGKDHDVNVALADRAQERLGLKELFRNFGLDTHPLVRVAFQEISALLKDKPKTKEGEEDVENKEDSWYTDYSEVGPKMAG